MDACPPLGVCYALVRSNYASPSVRGKPWLTAYSLVATERRI